VSESVDYIVKNPVCAGCASVSREQVRFVQAFKQSLLLVYVLNTIFFTHTYKTRTRFTRVDARVTAAAAAGPMALPPARRLLSLTVHRCPLVAVGLVVVVYKILWIGSRSSVDGSRGRDDVIGGRCDGAAGGFCWTLDVINWRGSPVELRR